MPRQIAAQVDNNFIAGLITDATVLNFPANCCTETTNCIFDDSGRITRRLGLDFEGAYDTKDAPAGDYIIRSFIWKEVNGDGTQNILVVQTGTQLNFYDLSFPIISQGEIADEISLLDYDVAGAVNVGNYACDFASGNGVLFVVHPRCEPFYVSYNASTGALTGTVIAIKIRDLVGVEDSLAVDARPTATVGTLSAEHKYNLFNQGWYFNGNSALTAWDTGRADMPSNADIWWFYKNTSDAFTAANVDLRTLGNSPAPKGHYIVNAFNIDRSTVSGVAGINIETTGVERPQCIAFFAGRAWYAGVQSAGRTNTLYFSQILESIKQAGYCYQANDPTSEDANELLPTDGGTIVIEGAGTVYALRPQGNGLLVFTSNGVYAVTGSQGLGFVTTDYSVMKISAIVAESPSSFVDIDGNICWWNNEGIHVMVAPDNVTFQIQTITDHKIRKFITEEVPTLNKKFVTGAYNPSTKTVQWFFSTQEPGTLIDSYTYDSCLVFNVLTQAFYVWRFPVGHNVRLHAVFAFKGFSGSVEPLTVVVGADPVVVGSDPVISYNLEGSAAFPIFKYVTTYLDSGTRKLTFSETVNPVYLDWATMGVVAYDSTFITGYKIMGDAQRFFQSNYAFVFLEAEEGAGGKVQAIWDWTTSGSTAKWSTQQTIYNPALIERKANFRRLKLRGKGRCLQLRIVSEPSKPFTICGWSIWNTINAGL